MRGNNADRWIRPKYGPRQDKYWQQRPSSRAATMSADASITYDHDAISAAELIELIGDAAVTAPISDLSIDTTIDKSQVEDRKPTPPFIPKSDLVDEDASRVSRFALGDDALALHARELQGNDAHELLGATRCLNKEVHLETDFENFDFSPELAELNTVILPDISFLIPDVGGAEDTESDSDYFPEVSEETRARQLAFSFLSSIGELTNRHADWVTEIILARRWSSAQSKVLELWRVGHSIKAIYSAFLLSEAWRDCDFLDERLGECSGYAWYLQSRPQLTWLEAIGLVTFHGEDSSVEEIMNFVESERYIWRQAPLLVQRFNRFKNYLLRHRIVDECRRPSMGWYRLLDPRDGRFFDGCTNPEYTMEWWEDDPPSRYDSRHTFQRIFMGDSLESLIPEPDDGLHWLED